MSKVSAGIVVIPDWMFRSCSGLTDVTCVSLNDDSII